MRAVIQRVSRAKVTVDDELVGEIDKGLVVLLGVSHEDQAKDVVYLAEKIIKLRIFDDQNGKMNYSVLEIGLPLLVVSQFTLYGDCRNGRRPDFTMAANLEIAKKYYETFCNEVSRLGVKVETGRFRSHMMVELINDGPVTIVLDSSKLF